MLKIETEVSRGIMFIRLNGSLSNKNFNKLGSEINYLLYKQGIQYYVLDFNEVKQVEENSFTYIQNKLVEIFLNSGQVVLCGMSEISKRKIGYTKDKLF